MTSPFFTGSKQYRVKKGDVIHVECMDAKPGETVEFRDVLFLSKGQAQVTVGTPVVPGCLVKAEYVALTKGPKIQSVKYKRRKNQYRKFGHRQKYAQMRIVDIVS